MSKGAVLILGSRSDIGRAIAHKFASLGHPIQLAARNAESLQSDKLDIELRHGVSVDLLEFDALAASNHSAVIESLSELPEIAISAIGYMGDQEESEHEHKAAASVIRSNFEAPASILAELANCFEKRGNGTLVGISSVAGERGRASNYVYGAAKAGFTAFLSGIRNRLASKGVHVVTVLPGFVATQMTAGMDLPKLLTAHPDEVANAIERAVRRQKNVIYIRTIWRFIMIIIRNIPETIFKKTSL